MATKVFDASAVAAFVFDEPEARFVEEHLRGGRRLAPTLLAYELGNICATKMRRRPTEEDQVRRSFALYISLGIAERPVDAAACLDLAHRTGLSAYDASYLWLARTMAVELVTLDKKLMRIAASG